MSKVSNKKELPAKEASLLKQVMSQYEFKQYKKGLKSVEAILRKFPEHGGILFDIPEEETLAMKGLFLYHLDQKIEAYDYVKKGLKNDLASSVCWHVYGLLYRSDKNYEEALKCYRFALKYQKESIQILRDFSFLQVQMRDYEGFHETKHTLLRLRPAQRVYWIGLAISYHLLGRHQEAIKVISVYEQTAKDRSEGSVDYEHSELLMYKNDLMTEAGDYENAYKQLIEVDMEVCDRKAYNFRKAELLVKLKRFEEAEKEYEFLLSDNTENSEILNGYLQALQLVEDGTNKPKDSGKIVQAIDKLRKIYPKSRMLQRMGLHYSEGKKFRDAAAEFLMSSFRKGVPSLFVSIKAMLQNPEKMDIISDLAFSFQDSLKKSFKFTKEAETEESPSTFLWVTFFLAQLKDLQGDHQAALDLINESIDHTPTLLELHMFKGRIFKHAGNSEYAAFVMDEARKLDLQDRFINCKSSKYYLRNDDINTAEKLMGLFTKQGDWEEKMHDLVEMQCLWFAIEAGQSYARTSQYGMALKKFEQVFKTFDDIEDDQFDFHTYSLRKMTIRSYISLLKMEDNLRSQKFFVKAAEGAIRIYIKLHDEPSLKEVKSIDPELEGMSENEKKKHLSKQKKQQAKELAAKDSNPKSEKDDKKKKDDDPAGLKHLKTSQPLAEAKRFLFHLQRQCPSLLITQELTFEIAMRENAYFVAYKALCVAKKYHPNSSMVHYMTVRLWNVFVNEKQSLNERLFEIVKELESTKFGSTKEVADYNLKHLEMSIAEKNVDHIIQAAEFGVSLDDTKRSEMLKNLCSCVEYDDLRVETAARLFDAVKRLGDSDGPKSFVSSFSEKASKKFPLSTIFFSPEQRKSYRDKVAAEKLDLEEAVSKEE